MRACVVRLPDYTTDHSPAPLPHVPGATVGNSRRLCCLFTRTSIQVGSRWRARGVRYVGTTTRYYEWARRKVNCRDNWCARIPCEQSGSNSGRVHACESFHL